MKVHVDCDVVAYRAGFAAEHNLYHVHYMQDGKEHIQSFDGAKAKDAFVEEKGFDPPDYWVETELHVEPEEAALFNVRSILKSIAEDLQVDLEEDVVCYVSGPDNYRNGIAVTKPYKGNRDPAKKPVHAPAIKQLLLSRYHAKMSDGQEADDDIAQAHYRMWQEDPESTVIATIDKDLDTIPGMHYNFVKKETYVVSPMEAKLKFWKQMLTGDTVDNIPGVPGVGPAKAAKLLADVEDELCMYKVVREEYRKSYGDKADEVMLEQGRLLFIRHGEVEWWRPPEEENG